MYLLLLCQMHDINCTCRESFLTTNRRNSLPCTVRTSRPRSCNQRVSWLLCSMARIYDLWEGSLDPCSAKYATSHRYMQIQYKNRLINHTLISNLFFQNTRKWYLLVSPRIMSNNVTIQISRSNKNQTIFIIFFTLIRFETNLLGNLQTCSVVQSTKD